MNTNPDLEMVQRFLKDPKPTTIATNPLLDSLSAQLLTYEPTTSVLTMSFKTPDLFRQGSGVVQGGALSMMLDFVLAFSAMAAVDDNEASIATISMSTDYLRPALSAEITAEGKVSKAGRNLVFADGQLTDGSKTIATAKATMFVAGPNNQTR